MTLDPTGKYGDVKKTVLIRSNDPVRPELAVKIHAFVEHGFEATPGKSLEQTLFGPGKCARCHSPRSERVVGTQLYQAICEMCHGPIDEYAKSLTAPMRDPDDLGDMIAAGTPESGMPGYSHEVSGPLTQGQINSLVPVLLNR